MNINSRLHLTGLCLTLVLAGSAFSQGLYWESTTNGGALGDQEKVTQSYAMQKKFKIVNSAMTMILRMDKGMVYTLDPQKKTYTEMTFAEMEAWAKKASASMDAARAKFRQKLKDMPPEKRKQMEGMSALMGGGSNSPVEVSGTGEKKSLNGYSCSKYVVKRDGKEMSTLWVTKDVSGWDNLRKDWMEFGKRMATMSNAGGMSEAYMKIDGFPMETDMMIGETKMTTVVIKIEAKPTPAAEFEVPAGYTKTEPPVTRGAKE